MEKFEFNLDPKEARQAWSDEDRPGNITATGAYRGTLTDAFVYESKNGALMLRLEFRSNDNLFASLDTCIRKRNGEKAFGMSKLHALLTVLRERSVVTQTVPNVPVFGQNHKQTVGRLTKLINRPVGLFLRAVHDPNRQKYPDSVELIIPFDPETDLTASEILDRTDPAQIAHLAETVTDRDVPLRDPFESPAPTSGAPDIQDSPADDVPF